MKNARPTEVKTSALDTRKFIGPGCPRQERLLNALLAHPVSREAADRIAGASNGPDVVARLRKRGLSAPCEMRRGIDRDGKKVLYGVYSLTDSDRQAVAAWKARSAILAPLAGSMGGA